MDFDDIDETIQEAMYSSAVSLDAILSNPIQLKIVDGTMTESTSLSEENLNRLLLNSFLKKVNLKPQ